MTKASSSAEAGFIDHALRGWELPPECEMRAEHAADAALARITSADETSDADADALLTPPLPAEPDEPGDSADQIQLPSRVETVTRDSKVIPISERQPERANKPWFRRPSIWGGLGTTFAAAAALAIWLRSPTENVSPKPIAAAPEQPQAAKSAASIAPPTLTVAELTQEEPPLVPMRSAEASEAEVPRKRSKHATAGGAKRKAAKASVGAEEQPKPPAEAPGPSPRMRPAAHAMNVADHPSTGELQASLGKVLPHARRCLPANHAPVPTQITFASDGRVSRVTANGGDASTQSCIKQALRQARVNPFARLRYSVSSTVRSSR